MESAPFSPQGLDADQLEKEEALVLKSIDSVQEAVKEIDFTVINEILRDIYTKFTGDISDEDRNFYFKLDENFNIRVKYTELINFSHYGAFISNTTNIKAYTRDGGIIIFAREYVNSYGDTDSKTRLALLRDIIHEMLHIKSSFAEEDIASENLKFTSGISPKQSRNKDETLIIHDDNKSDDFIIANEGLTELITDAIFSEYLARSGKLKELEQDNGSDIQADYIDRGALYFSGRLALVSLVSMIAEYTGVSEDKVYQAFVIEYLTGGDIMRAEIMDECKDSPEISAFLEKMKSNDLKDIVKSYSEKERNTLLDFMNKHKLVHIKAILGRDYIGETNKNRVLRKK